MQEKSYSDLALSYHKNQQSLFFGQRYKNPKVLANSSPFCTAAVARLKAGPDNVASIIANGTNYTDKLFTGKDMVWW